MDRAIKSLRKLKDDGIPEPLGRVLASTAVPASVAHTVRGHVLQGRPSAVIGLMDAISREFGDTCAHDIADYIYELENWQCTQQHILEMLPQLGAAGVPEDVRYALDRRGWRCYAIRFYPPWVSKLTSRLLDQSATKRRSKCLRFYPGQW